MPRRKTIADAALEAIESHGPQRLMELVNELVEAEVTAARNPEQAVRRVMEGDTRFVRGLDDRYFSVAAQLQGAWLSHRLEHFERQNHVLVLRPSDWLLSLAIRDRQNVGSSGPLFETHIEDVFPLPDMEMDDEDLWPYPDHDAATTDPDGQINFVIANRWTNVVTGTGQWLSEFIGNEYLGARVGRESIELVGLNGDEFISSDVERAAEFVRSCISSDGADMQPAREVLIRLLTEAPDLLKCPLPPLDELVANTGVVLVDESIVRWKRPLLGLELVSTDHYSDHMATSVNATEAKARLLALLDRIVAGEEIEITRHGKVVARLIPAAGPSALRDSMVGVARTTSPDDDLLSADLEWNVA